MILYKCQKCGTELKNPDEMAGKEDCCPECQASHIVPLSKTARTGKKGIHGDKKLLINAILVVVGLLGVVHLSKTARTWKKGIHAGKKLLINAILVVVGLLGIVPMVLYYHKDHDANRQAALMCFGTVVILLVVRMLYILNKSEENAELRRRLTLTICSKCSHCRRERRYYVRCAVREHMVVDLIHGGTKLVGGMTCERNNGHCPEFTLKSPFPRYSYSA